MAKKKKGETKGKHKWMKVTPTRAADWLEKNVINRPLNNTRVEEIVEAIRADEWRGDNSETIKISPKGRLVDGQHRLWAIVETNMSIWCWVAFGVPEDTYHTIDTGKIRSAADALEVQRKQGGQEYIYRNYLAAATKLYHRYDVSALKGFLLGPANVRVTNTKVLKTLTDHPEIADSVYFVGALKHVKGINKSKMCFLHCLFAKKNATTADEFMEKLYTGEDLKKGSPILALRNKLINLQGQKGAINGHPFNMFVMVITIKAWNALRKKKSRLVLSWGETEKPPTIK